MAPQVLIVDDNPTNRELMLYLLKAFGYEAVGAADGLAGLDAARAGRFDLILVDMLMPGIDGYEFARRCQADESLRYIPLIAVTALAMAGDRGHVLAAGLDGYLSKPIDPPSFASTIERFLTQRQRVERRAPADVSGHVSPEVKQSGNVVLAVDDAPENLDYVRAALAPFGYRVVDANSVDEAILLLERTQPAIVLCDLHMPGRDGFDLLEYIKANSSIPFVFVSSTGWEPGARRRGLDLGASKFLKRPIEAERLRNEIEEVLLRGNG